MQSPVFVFGVLYLVFVTINTLHMKSHWFLFTLLDLVYVIAGYIDCWAFCFMKLLYDFLSNGLINILQTKMKRQSYWQILGNLSCDFYFLFLTILNKHPGGGSSLLSYCKFLMKWYIFKKVLNVIYFSYMVVFMLILNT